MQNKLKPTESVRLNELLIDSLPHPAMLIRRDRIVLVANRIAREAGAIVGDLCWKTFGHGEYIPDDRKQYINNHKGEIAPCGTKCTSCLADEAFEEGKPKNNPEVEAFGQLWDIWWMPLDDKLYLHYAVNITERNRMEKALQRARDELEQRVEERTAELLQSNVLLKEEITERKRTEKRLRKSEERLAEAQSIARLGNWDWDIIKNRLWWSDEIYRIFGVEPRKFGATYDAFLGFVHPDDMELVKKAVDAALYEGKPYGIDHRIVLADGTERIVHEQGSVSFDDAGKAIWMAGTVQDITERKQVEDMLRASEERFRTVADFAYNWEYWIGPGGDYLYVSPSCERITGYRADEFERDPNLLLAIMHPDDRPLVTRHIEEALESRDALSVYFRIISRSSEELWIAHSCQPVYAKEGHCLGRRASNRDVTATRLIRQDLEESKERLRQLSSRLFNAHEEERRRVALELHDSIGQTLSAIKFRLETTLEEMPQERPGRISYSLSFLIPMVQEAIDEVHKISQDLRPSILDDLGIVTTISSLCRKFETTYQGIRIQKELDIEENDVPDSLKIVIYRILQEALNNIARHSQADRVCLSLKRSDSTIGLTIDDNGVGFDVGDIRSGDVSKRGLGIAGMKERVELSGGSFSIEFTKGAGTTVLASWPSGEIEPGAFPD